MSDAKQLQNLEIILQQLEALPTLPAVAMKLLRVTGDDSSSAKEVVQLVKSDPSLTGKVLAMCRGVDKGVRHEVVTVDKAVMLLGFDAIRNAVLSIKVFETFGQGEAAAGKAEDAKPTGFDRANFWRHSLAVAVAAELIAARHPEHQKTLNPSEAFVCGLLHDLGKLALDYVLPRSYERVVELAEQSRANISDCERKVIGLDHHIVGKRLAEYWQLPHVLQDCIWLHGSPWEAVPELPHRMMIGLISLADLVVRQQHIGYSGNYQLNHEVAERAQAMGLDGERVKKVMNEVHEELERRSQALGLGSAPSRELFLESIMQANALLANMNRTLERRTRVAQAHDKVMSAIGAFHADLGRAVQNVQGVLGAVAGSAAGVLGGDYFGILFQPSASASWLLVQYGQGGQPVKSELIEPPDGSQWLAKLGTGANGGAELMGVMPWVAGRIIPGVEARAVRMAALPCGWGTAAVLMHSGGVDLSPPQVEALTHTWGAAIAASVQHEGAKRLGERMSDINRQLLAAQDELLSSQSMARVGELAAGAAHEMNNPLAVISGRAQLLASQLPIASKEQAAAELIYRQAQKLSDLITSLRLFADPPRPQFRWVSIEELVLESVNQAKMRAPDAPAVRVAAPEGLGKIWTDKTQLCDAIGAVVVNAMQSGTKESVRIVIQVDPFKDRLEFGVLDKGVGMDDHTLAHAFDPFFSAKPAGRQVGLGLSRAQRLIEGLGGKITLSSRPNEGTTATLSLPLMKPEKQEQPQATNRPAEPVVTLG